jgi:magnesium transporter
LRSNETVLEKLLRAELIKKYPEDAELLEDVIVENKQAIEMANIYSGILSGMMDAFASVISNNLNIVMKVLAIITIVMAIPTMIFSAYGMNVNMSGMPFTQSVWAFPIIIVISVALSLTAILVINKIKMFK